MTLNVPETEFHVLTEIEGFTVVVRANKHPRVHQLRPFESCNTDDAHQKERIKGSRELIVRKFGPAIACARCFPNAPREVREAQAAIDDSATPEGSFTPAALAEQMSVDPELAHGKFVGNGEEDYG